MEPIILLRSYIRSYFMILAYLIKILRKIFFAGYYLVFKSWQVLLSNTNEFAMVVLKVSWFWEVLIVPLCRSAEQEVNEYAFSIRPSMNVHAVTSHKLHLKQWSLLIWIRLHGHTCRVWSLRQPLRLLELGWARLGLGLRLLGFKHIFSNAFL